MKHTAESTPENKRYNTEVSFLDGLFEFHPHYFDELTDEQLRAIRTYYLTNCEVPENIFKYRATLLVRNPGVEAEAHVAFNKLCALAGVKDFT